MRALIRCTTDLTPEQMSEVVQKMGWLPRFPQDHVEVVARREEMLKDIATEDQAMVAGTVFLVVYNDEVKTWGIVNAPTAGRITVRLNHPVTARLQEACEKFVAALQSAVGLPDKDGIDHLDFLPDVQFLLPGTNTVGLRGEIISEARLQSLLRERKVEFTTARSALLLAFVVLIITTPPIEKPFYAMDEAWAKWFFGNLERLGTAAITTATLFTFDILSRLRALRENTVIRWL